MIKNIQRKQKPIVREKIIIYLDLSSDIISKKELRKALDIFVKAKFECNPHHDFNIFYFKEDGSPVIHENLKDPKSFKKIINIADKERAQNTNYFENGLFFCLSGIASSFLAHAITFRILVISDLPSGKNSEYMDALMNLVETVRIFPTFIDIIRIGNKRMYPDDVKLRVISTITNGGLFYIESPKEMINALNSLVKNKVLPDLRPEGGQNISIEHKEYYQNLSLSLEDSPLNLRVTIKCELCEKVICEYCNNINDSIKTCPSCGIGMHECCSALYSWNYNIGIKNIFRCPKCKNLIKLNEETVYRINGEDIPKIEKEIEEESDEINEVDIEQKEVWIPKEEEKNEIQAKKIETGQEKTSVNQEKEEIKQTKVTGPKMGLFGPRHRVKRKTPAVSEEDISQSKTPVPVQKEKKN